MQAAVCIEFDFLQEKTKKKSNRFSFSRDTHKEETKTTAVGTGNVKLQTAIKKKNQKKNNSNNMTEHCLDKFFSDDEDGKRDNDSSDGSDSDSDSYAEDEIASAAPNTAAAASQKIAAPAAPAFTPIKLFDVKAPVPGAGAEATAAVTTTTGMSQDQMFGLILSAMHSGLGLGPSPIAVQPSGKYRTVTFSYSGSLNDLANSSSGFGTLTCSSPELAAHLGGANAPIREAAIESFSNDFPVSMKITANDLVGDKIMNHLTDSGPCMIEVQPTTSMVFAQPAVVFRCQQSEFQAEVMSKFPGLRVEDIGNDVRSFGDLHAGNMYLPETSIVMSGIHQEIQAAQKSGAANGEGFAAMVPQRIGTSNLFVVPTKLATAAINMLTRTLAATKDRVDVAKDLKFHFSRSCLSAATRDTASSATAESVWLDKRQLRNSLKSGHTIETLLNKKYELSLKVRFKID